MALAWHTVYKEADAAKELQGRSQLKAEVSYKNSRVGPPTLVHFHTMALKFQSLSEPLEAGYGMGERTPSWSI